MIERRIWKNYTEKRLKWSMKIKMGVIVEDVRIFMVTMNRKEVIGVSFLGRRIKIEMKYIFIEEQKNLKLL